jgi:FG-GAP repeat
MSPLQAKDRSIAAFSTQAWALAALLTTALIAALSLLPQRGHETTSPSAGPSSHALSTAAGRSLQQVPPAARAQVSAALGAGRPAFHIYSGAKGALSARTLTQGLRTSFASGGVTIQAASLKLHLSLRSLGFGEGIHQQAVKAASPAASTSVSNEASSRPAMMPRNRVSYARGALSEWYVNGPAGLEQGFTLARAPARQTAEPLTLTLSLQANARARLAPDAQSLTLQRSGALLRYGGLQTTDAKGRVLRTWLGLEGSRVLIHVDAARASYPLSIDPLVQAGGKLTAGDEQGEGLLGTSVALSADGSTMLVGGPQDANSAHGAAWVFVRSGAAWVQQGSKLTGAEAPEEPAEEEQCAEESMEEAGECAFGNSVALSADGNTALIGEPSATTRHGNAWIFKRSGETWTRTSVLTGGTGSDEGRFGKSVGLSADGTTALIGDPSATGQRGSAWVFKLSGSVWNVEQTLAEATAGHQDHFGRAVALSSDGNTALIGAPGAAGYTGKALVYTRTGSAWSQLGGELTGAGEEGEGRFGKSLALSGDGETALVGGTTDAGGRGAVWPFVRSGSSFAPQGGELRGPAEESSRFGFSVALSGDGTMALVGMPKAPFGGSVAQLTRSGSTWTQLGEELAGTESQGKSFAGAAVALSSDGAVGAVGAPHDNARIGAAWVFAESPTVQGPVVTGVVPGFGPAGTVVRVKGSGFAGATAVSFGSTPASSFKVKSGVTIEAVAPAGEGVVHVTVQTPGGTSTINTEDTFRYTTGKAKGGGSENENPGGGGAGGGGAGQGGTPGTPGTGTITGGAKGGVLGTSLADRTACRLSLRSKRLAVTGSRTVALRLLRTGTGACSGKLTLSFKKARGGKRAKLQTLGTATFSVAPGTSKVLKITLNKLGRKLFRSHGNKLSASLSMVRSVPAPRLASSASVRLTVKKSKKVTLTR